MGKARLEAFSDGVIAVIITIMVLELKIPRGSQPSDLLELAPVFFSYVLSFVYVAIYWNNHHHMLHTVQRVTGGILWANLHLLFWLSLVPSPPPGWRKTGSRLADFPLRTGAAADCDRLFHPADLRDSHARADSLLAKAIGADLQGQDFSGAVHRTQSRSDSSRPGWRLQFTLRWR